MGRVPVRTEQRGRKRLAATSSSCLALLVRQLLIEIALVDLEARQIQRFG